jgi:hypothetical protein
MKKVKKKKKGQRESERDFFQTTTYRGPKKGQDVENLRPHRLDGTDRLDERFSTHSLLRIFTLSGISL